MGQLEDWTRQALIITSGFEGAGDPWQNCTGDFDGQGLSCGALQWAVGQGTQQKLVGEFVTRNGSGILTQLMPRFGLDYLEALKCAIPVAVQRLSKWSSGAKVLEPMATELRAFWGSGPMQALQIEAAGGIGRWAFDQAVQWSKDWTDAEDPAEPAQVDLWRFAFFFDIRVNNGGLADLSLTDVLGYAQQHAPACDRANQLLAASQGVADWLAGRDASIAGFKDVQRNAVLWSDEVKMVRDESKALLLLAWLRALKARPQYQGATLNRHGTLALGIGWVDGELHNYRASFNWKSA